MPTENSQSQSTCTTLEKSRRSIHSSVDGRSAKNVEAKETSFNSKELFELINGKFTAKFDEILPLSNASYEFTVLTKAPENFVDKPVVVKYEKQGKVQVSNF